MFSKTLFVCIIVFFLTDFSRGQDDVELFKGDYIFIEAVNSFYKMHTTPQNWSDAKQMCAQEGASLFYPENEDEQNAVMSFRNTTLMWVFLGISDLMTKGVFETIDGKALSQVYNNWKSNEPNNVNGEEDCVEQDNEGKMNDVKCSQKFSFICKKSLSTPERNNNCNKYGLTDTKCMWKDYTYIGAVNSFYKIHPTSQNWLNAKLECALEGASLFYPENEDEQNAVMSFRKTTQPDVKWTFVGISDLTTEGVFETIDGKPLSQVYSNWKSNEPNDVNGEEDCVEQDNAGKMNDVRCSEKFSFICKKSLSTSERNNSCNKDGQKGKEYTRKDYTNIEAVNSFYKIHKTPQNWSDAKQLCVQEGAKLFYPENEDEQNAVMSFRKTTKPDVEWTFVGISDLMTEGVFETIDGKALSQVYSNWKSNEPNNVNGEEDCVEQDNEGKMNDVKCSEKFSFICKKSLPTPERNNSCNKSGLFRKDYTYVEEVNSFYKIHAVAQNWSDAKQMCAQEGASLFYPENEVEQYAVMSFRNTTMPDVKWVFVGISDLITEGVFETIDGKPLSQVYSKWKSNEPNNVNGEEDCVEQDNAGKMNDVKCSEKFSFICKKSLSTPERNNSCNKNGQKDKEYTRKDYTYIEAVNGFYKIHQIAQNWSDAKQLCVQEGAKLFYPENENEQNAVMSFRKTTKPDVEWTFVGISDLMTEGVFETIDGTALSQVYSNWKSNEPNNVNGEEDCVEQDNEGKMNDVKCSEKFSFICKKSLPTLERNNSCNKDEQKDKDFMRKSYTYIEVVNSFYKINTIAQNWSDAKQLCAQEGASLFYPENEDEQNAVMSFRNRTNPDLKSVFVGMSDLLSEGIFNTIDGKSISDVYSKWKSGEPNDETGEEDCVEQDSAGEISVRKCSEKLSFICKKSGLPTERNNSTDIDGEKNNKVTREDYTYIRSVNSFYKIHTIAQNWSDAKQLCAQEGASLFNPENENEQNAVMAFRNRTHPDLMIVFVGMSDLLSEGVFNTIDGKSISDVYSKWKSGEPNDETGEEDCVEQDSAGEISVRKCSEKLSFICKKSGLPTEPNNSTDIDREKDNEIIRKDFTYIEAVNSFYKIHTIAQNWSDAKQLCALEEASLFYPANEDEQNAVMSFQNTTKPDVKRVFVGISDLTTEGVFETIDGKSFSDVYNNWKSGEPNDETGEEDCVEQDNTGAMSDSKCSEKLSFICKKSFLSLEKNNNSNMDGQKDKAFFRKDYTYIKSENSFYKIHPTPQKWSDAQLECALEGARLFYSENDDEQNAVMSFRNMTQPDIKRMFVGISDLTSEGVFETIDGRSVSDVYNKWRPGEPRNSDNDENCVEQDDAGEMSDCKCSEKLAFICKKSLSVLQRNSSCNVDYSFDENSFKCYKVHSTPLEWARAYVVCRSEEAHLAVINNRLEGDYLANLTESASKQISGGNHQLYRGIYHLGFHYKFREGWQTVRGTPFYVDDDVWWNNNQPIIDENEQCGSMFYTGRLHGVDCDTNSFFICEQELDRSNMFEEMFQ